MSQDLIRVSGMEVFFQQFRPQFDIIQDLMSKWIDKLILLTSNSVSNAFK